MKRQSAEIKDKPRCHPNSKFRPLVFSENGKTYLSGRVFICSGCMHDPGLRLLAMEL